MERVKSAGIDTESPRIVFWDMKLLAKAAKKIAIKTNPWSQLKYTQNLIQ